MKSALKKFFIFIFILLIIGLFFGIYVMQAPPVAETAEPKLMVHVNTAFRQRPTVNSRPVGYLKDKHLYSLDLVYLSNLNSSIFSEELLFNVVLGVRGKYNAQLLDKEVTTGFDWQKMFKESAVGIRLKPGTPKIKTVLTGKHWVLTDKTGAGYLIHRTRDELEIYLPNLSDAFEINNMKLSDDFEFTEVQPGKQWFIEDNKKLQSYEIRSSAKKLDVYNLSKVPIQTLLFDIDATSQMALPEGELSDEVYNGFKSMNIPLSPKVKVVQGEDGMSWKVTDGTQKYTIRNEDGQLKTYLDLDSGWLLLKVKRAKGWVQSKRGTIILPPEPMLTSRQQLKKNMQTFFAGVKSMFGISKQNDP